MVVRKGPVDSAVIASVHGLVGVREQRALGSGKFELVGLRITPRLAWLKAGASQSIAFLAGQSQQLSKPQSGGVRQFDGDRNAGITNLLGSKPEEIGGRVEPHGPHRNVLFWSGRGPIRCVSMVECHE
jgi:hypothetical protein